ncbi:16S rRNA (cytidine(1402)-2'-O)-methyltransferase [Salinisphaera sp. USBA-960]|nr:16S rRNA (cytidine(1402)-2'-O)-methyltransferase [Salifodinibacter halophilus]NNC26768.1 16S rRNA (cytidine(1402)-2'-O)-methyltransferase [Salifodinibacter halophilus]
MTARAGTLYVVATPIGNRGELSARAREMLAAVDAVAAEDTRHTGVLLRDFAIDTPLESLHEHSDAARWRSLLNRLAAGQSVALVSDAGTPGISDPGFELIRGARAHGIDVRPVAGPCAAIAALSVSGLPTDRFVFEGFLPARSVARRRRLAALADESRTLIFYEAGRRMRAMLADCRDAFGDERRIAVARELTKRFEESAQLDLADGVAWVDADANRTRGEFVVCVAGAARATDKSPTADLDALLTELVALTGTREAARIAARTLGVARNAAYQRALVLARE